MHVYAKQFGISPQHAAGATDSDIFGVQMGHHICVSNHYRVSSSPSTGVLGSFDITGRHQVPAFQYAFLDIWVTAVLSFVAWVGFSIYVCRVVWPWYKESGNQVPMEKQLEALVGKVDSLASEVHALVDEMRRRG